MNKEEPLQNTPSLSSATLRENDETVEEALQKMEWERQYFRSDEELGFAIATPIVLIGGIIIGVLIIWLFVQPR